MKKIFILFFASILVLSCTKDVDSTADLSATISQYDATNLGVYKGVFTTQGTLERGIVEINIIPGNYATATILTVKGITTEFRSNEIIQEGMEINDLKMTTLGFGETSFMLSVDMDGSNVIITKVIYNGKEAGMIAAHETSRAPVVPITGVLACDDCDAHPLLVTGDTGTFSLLFVGDGSADDTVSALADVGTIVTTPGAQSLCGPVGSQVLCAIDGGATIGTNLIGWTGTHLYNTADDCSEAAGTWSLDSGNHGSFTGTFTSDVSCTAGAPANDTCAAAEAAVCGGSYTGNTDLATDDDGLYGPDVWYSLTGLTSGDDVTVSLCGGLTDYDSRLVIYDACGGTELFNNDDSCGLQSEITYNTDGSDVLVSVQAFSAGTGNFGLDITCVPGGGPEDFTPDCGDTAWVDDGGVAGDYGTGQTVSWTVDAGAGNVVTSGFTTFDLESSWDYMSFYDGPTVGDPEIVLSDLGVGTTTANGGSGFTGGDLLGDSVTSTGQFLTIQFFSDASVPFPGWVGQVTCAPPSPVSQDNTDRNAKPVKKATPLTAEQIALKKVIMRKLGLK